MRQLTSRTYSVRKEYFGSLYYLSSWRVADTEVNDAEAKARELAARAEVEQREQREIKRAKFFGTC